MSLRTIRQLQKGQMPYDPTHATPLDTRIRRDRKRKVGAGAGGGAVTYNGHKASVWGLPETAVVTAARRRGHVVGTGHCALRGVATHTHKEQTP